MKAICIRNVPYLFKENRLYEYRITEFGYFVKTDITTIPKKEDLPNYLSMIEDEAYVLFHTFAHHFRKFI